MLFRRTCKLVELENAQRNAEKAKPVKKAAVSVCIHTIRARLPQSSMCTFSFSQQVAAAYRLLEEKAFVVL